MFLDLAIHDFDMVRFQVGEVEEVYATGGVLIEPELKEFGDIDTDVVTLKFANGAIGVDRQQPQGGLRLRPAAGGILLERHSHGKQRSREHHGDKG